MNQPTAGSSQNLTSTASIKFLFNPSKPDIRKQRKRLLPSSLTTLEDKRRRKGSEKLSDNVVSYNDNDTKWPHSDLTREVRVPVDSTTRSSPVLDIGFHLMKSSCDDQVLSKGEAEALFSKEKKTYSNCVERARQILESRCGPSSLGGSEDAFEQRSGDFGHPTKLPLSKSTSSFLLSGGHKTEGGLFSPVAAPKHFCTCTPKTPAVTRGQSTQVQLPLPSEQDEVEVVSLLDEKLPRYKLRVDTITEFTGYPNEDFVGIPFPALEDYTPVSPEQAYLTLSYFLLSGERVSQMTKTFSDIEALQRLLQEKERDLELAAKIGQQLLEDNRTLEERVATLDAENKECTEQVTQLRHDLQMKTQLLHWYNETSCESAESSKAGTPMCSTSNVLERRLAQLEEENESLRSETARIAEDVEKTEAEEKYLVDDAIRRLGETNRRVNDLSEELHKKTEENLAQQEELRLLTDEIRAYEDLNAEVVAENTELRNMIHSLKCVQDQLSTELIDLKDNYVEVVGLLKETQEQLREAQTKKDEGEDVVSVFNSLAYEIESSVARHRRASDYFRRTFDTVRAANNSSICSSGIFSLSDAGTSSLDMSLTPTTCADMLPSGFSNSGASSPGSAGWRLPEKLQIVKPREGSNTLSVWSSLATPHLGKLLDKHPGVRMRVESRLSKSPNGSGDCCGSSKDLNAIEASSSKSNSANNNDASMSSLSTSLAETRIAGAMRKMSPSLKAAGEGIVHSTMVVSKTKGAPSGIDSIFGDNGKELD